MKPSTTAQGKRRAGRPKRVTEEQAEQELEQLVDQDEHQERDGQEQIELTAGFAAERIHLEIQHRDRVLALESQHKADLARLDARQAVEIVKLWKRQGRPLGAWAQRIIEGVKNGSPG